MEWVRDEAHRRWVWTTDRGTVIPRRAFFLASFCLIGLFVLAGLLGPGGWLFGILVTALFGVGIGFLMQGLCWGPNWTWDNSGPD